MNFIKMKATYVSVWDGGTEISSNCEYDPITTNVTLIDSVSVDLDDLESLEREYIILPDGTEIERNYFITEFDTDDELTSEEIERLKILTLKQIKMKDFLNSVDWSLLREQKEQLFSAMDAEHLINPAQYEAIEGVIMLISGLQDYAVDAGFFSSSEVFNFKND